LDSRTLNDSVSEGDEDSSDETIKDDLLFEEVSILYSKCEDSEEKKIITEKYSKIMSELNNISDGNFDVFNLSILSDNMELFFLMNHLFFYLNFDTKLNIDFYKYRNYFDAINKGYRKNPYHNSIHGCDVTQSIFFIIKSCSIESICNINDLELFSILFASAIHDLDHPGNNNNWEIEFKTPLALCYNDKSVLENYHLCKAFLIANKKESCNIFSNFSVKDYNTIRSMVISMVLATDMANHFSDLYNLINRAKSLDFNPSGTDKQILFNQLVHASDISSPIKPIQIYREWVERVFLEFFIQGDKEKENNLKTSFLCDRNTTNIVDGQIGFLNGIVFPLFDALTVPFPGMKIMVEAICNNTEEFKKMKESGYIFKV